MPNDETSNDSVTSASGLSVGGPERHATWLELFFDLVFVAAITAIGGELAKQSTWSGVLVYLALFIPLWWPWVGYAVYANRFDRDERAQRLVTCLMMFAAAGMLVELGHIQETGGVGFVMAYVTARVALLLLYAREAHQPETRPLCQLYLRGFGLGAALWLVSLLFPTPARYAFWAIGLAVDMATPWMGRPMLQRWPLNVTHLPERMGLFTLIVLGESIVAVVGTLSHEVLTAGRSLLAALAFVVAISIWWSYFSFVARVHFECRLGSGQPYIYTHLPVAMGLVCLAAGIKRAIHEGAQPALDPMTLLLLGGGAIIWLLGFLGVQLVSYVAFPRKQVGVYVGASIGVVLIALAGPFFSPLVTFGALTALFLAVAALMYKEPTAA